MRERKEYQSDVKTDCRVFYQLCPLQSQIFTFLPDVVFCCYNPSDSAHGGCKEWLFYLQFSCLATQQ